MEKSPRFYNVRSGCGTISVRSLENYSRFGKLTVALIIVDGEKVPALCVHDGFYVREFEGVQQMHGPLFLCVKDGNYGLAESCEVVDVSMQSSVKIGSHYIVLEDAKLSLCDRGLLIETRDEKCHCLHYQAHTLEECAPEKPPKENCLAELGSIVHDVIDQVDEHVDECEEAFRALDIRVDLCEEQCLAVRRLVVEDVEDRRDFASIVQECVNRVDLLEKQLQEMKDKYDALCMQKKYFEIGEK